MSGWDDFIARDTAEREAEAAARATQKNGQDDPNGFVSLDITVAADLADKPVPERAWLVDRWIPAREVTLFSGDGGVGKSLAAMQLQIAAAAGCRWFGLPVLPSRTVGIYAEDEPDELHRRLVALTELMGVDIAALSRMAWRSAVADEADLSCPTTAATSGRPRISIGWKSWRRILTRTVSSSMRRRISSVPMKYEGGRSTRSCGSCDSSQSKSTARSCCSLIPASRAHQRQRTVRLDALEQRNPLTPLPDPHDRRGCRSRRADADPAQGQLRRHRRCPAPALAGRRLHRARRPQRY
jgi:hypothetical protein